jgi:hypothetical protein
MRIPRLLRTAVANNTKPYRKDETKSPSGKAQFPPSFCPMIGSITFHLGGMLKGYVTVLRQSALPFKINASRCKHRVQQIDAEIANPRIIN